MARYILIDNNSGFVFGDTATLPGAADAFTQPTDEGADAAIAARLLDESIGGEGRTYETWASAPSDAGTGYHVYRADVGGSDAVTVCTDGQDQAYIESVERDCRYVGFVACTPSVSWRVWEDGKKDEALTVHGNSIPAALDVAAKQYGFVDYADMAHARQWGESDGLNIEAASSD